MPGLEQPSGENNTPTPNHDGNAPADGFDTEPAEPIPAREALSSSARMLEVAANTADQLGAADLRPRMLGIAYRMLGSVASLLSRSDRLPVAERAFPGFQR